MPASWPIFLLSVLIRPTYVRLTTFHMEMYFSIQFEMQVSSDDDMDEPGLGKQCSKQLLLTRCGLSEDGGCLLGEGVHIR